MKELIFSTGNNLKFGKGKAVCDEYGITLTQNTLDIDEIQSEDTEYVARRKAEAAFQLLKQPVIISDDAWAITALNGFPGTYAKSVNHWFTPEDYLRLLHDSTDRSATFTQTLVYQDEHVQKLFSHQTIGEILHESRGTAGASIMKIVSFEDDKQKSISEVIGSGSHYSGKSTLQVWKNFAEWFTKEIA